MLNLTRSDRPRPVPRRRAGVHVVTLISADGTEADLQALCYATLIRTFANVVVCVVGEANGSTERPDVFFTTPEAGFYRRPLDGAGVWESLQPIVDSRFAIENAIHTDLPRRLWAPSAVCDDLCRYGAELDRLGVLPTPFPLRELLDERMLRHLYRIFGITGVSYGNLSAREVVPELGAHTFWMSGRGVNKAALEGPGRDVFLVTNVDDDAGVVHVSVPPEHDETKRVSVDAVEHERIYREFPKVGAIVHVHAWIEGAITTHQNHPCGTVELADEVVTLLRTAPTPHRAVIGLKNHGLTITGRDLEDVFSRIRGQLQTEVPMFA